MAQFNYNKSYEDFLKEYYEKEKQRKQYEARNNPGSYSSKYQSYINDYMGRIANRKPFSYDPNSDALYQSYKNQYSDLGRRAMQDTMGQAAQLTGGYGNSYANTVGQQTYNSYMQRAADKIPELAELAYNRYAREGEDLYNQLAMYQNADATDYGRYRDRVGDYQTMLNYYAGLADTAYSRGVNRYDTDYGNAYNMWRAQQADEQNARDYAFQREQYEYQKQQDAAQQAYNYAKLNADNNSAEYEKQISELQAQIEALKKENNSVKKQSMNPKIESSITKETNAIVNNKNLSYQMKVAEYDKLAEKYINMGYSEDDVYRIIHNTEKTGSATTNASLYWA